MQLIDFAFVGLAIAAPLAQSNPAAKAATTCPDLSGAQVLSNNNQAYKLDCGSFVDAGAEAILRTTTTEIGYKGCLTACDGTVDCGISQYVATDFAQTKGTCTLFKNDAPVKPIDGSTDSWTLATKIESGKKSGDCPAPEPKPAPAPPSYAPPQKEKPAPAPPSYAPPQKEKPAPAPPSYAPPQKEKPAPAPPSYAPPTEKPAPAPPSYAPPQEEPKPKPEDEGSLPIPKKDDKFTLIAIRPDTAVQNTGITAANGTIMIGGTQDATCDAQSDFAIFYIQDDEAYLYAESATPQKLWVDRSGMGQGVSGYTTGAQPAPRNAETKGFKVTKKGYLEFDGTGTYACPPDAENEDAGYSIWFTNNEKPGFQEGCIPVALRAIKADDPVSCVYTSGS